MIEIEGAKIATKEESIWINVVKNLETQIENLERELKVNKVFLATAKIMADKESFISA